VTMTARRILLVDSDPDQVELYQAALIAEGYDVMAASDGPRGLVQARLVHPDTVILETRLPRLSGLELCRSLRSDPAFADVDIVILTAARFDVDDHGVEAFGAAAVLLKPCYPEDLIACLRSLE
jgi:two-component system, OmpR family, phosphate regulon response regulator PhoB